MFKKTLACAVLVALSGCSEPTNTATNKEAKAPMSQANSVNYPVTKKGNVVDNYFGETLADPYRWLEDDMSAETANWVKAQNKVTFSYLAQAKLFT